MPNTGPARANVDTALGSRELHVTDPDGHVLRFGASAPKGAPLGEWLDDKGGDGCRNPTAAGSSSDEGLLRDAQHPILDFTAA